MESFKVSFAMRRTAFLVLMLVSPMACASDFRGFLTVFVGFPSIALCNLVLGAFLVHYHLGQRASSLLLLFPLTGGAFVLTGWIAFLGGMFVLQGNRSSDGWQSLVMFPAMLVTLVSSLLVMLLLLHSYADEQSRRGKRAARVVVILALASSLLVGIDFQALMGKAGPDVLLVVPYALLLGLALVFCRLVLRLPAERSDGVASGEGAVQER